MYLIVIAWMYVVLMMSVAEASNSTGTLLGALVTFVLYGVGPVTLAVYLMGAPARSKAIKQREALAHAARIAAAHPAADMTATSLQPDAGGHASGGAKTVSSESGIAPMGKEL